MGVGASSPVSFCRHTVSENVSQAADENYVQQIDDASPLATVPGLSALNQGHMSAFPSHKSFDSEPKVQMLEDQVQNVKEGRSAYHETNMVIESTRTLSDARVKVFSMDAMTDDDRVKDFLNQAMGGHVGSSDEPDDPDKPCGVSEKIVTSAPKMLANSKDFAIRDVDNVKPSVDVTREAPNARAKQSKQQKTDIGKPCPSLPRVQQTNKGQVSSATDLGQKESPFGNVYVQREGRGVASYHIDGPADAYISYKKPKPSWILDNGKPFPKKKYFQSIKYEPSTRTLRATIDWSPHTKGGHQRWEFEMVFNVSFSRINDGFIKMFPPGAAAFEKMARFGREVEYRLLKDENHQKSLEDMEKARQLLA